MQAIDAAVCPKVDEYELVFELIRESEGLGV
jgi:hypothetical protein